MQAHAVLTFLPALLLAAAAPQGPSVACLNLDAKGGISKDHAELLTDNVISHVRDTGFFSRVVSAKEIESALGMEQQRQVLDCNSQSCVAEIAGALNVEFLLSGNVGQVGGAILLNLRLVNVRTGVGVSSVSERVDGDITRVLDRVNGKHICAEPCNMCGQAACTGGVQCDNNTGFCVP
jgi:TolB-like protein